MAKTLTDKQELFCEHYVANGGKGADAARAAGYAEDSARETAWKLLRKAHIQSRVHSLTEQRFTEIAPDMTQVLLNLAQGARSELVRYNSAKDLLDRAGFKGLEKVLNLSESSTLNEQDLRDRVDDLMAELFGKADTQQVEDRQDEHSSSDGAPTSRQAS